MERKISGIGIEKIGQAFTNEYKVIFRDRGAILVLFIAVWIYPLVYSIAYQENVVHDIPFTIVDLDRTSLSRQMIRMIDATQEIKIERQTGDFHEAEKLFWDGETKGTILIPADFEKEVLKGGQTNIGIYCDGGYFLIYKESLRGALRAAGTLSAAVEVKRMMAKGTSLVVAMQQREPITMKSYSLFNPAGSYGSYIMPGVILVILQQTLLVGIGMIGGGRREKQKLLLSAHNHEFSTIFHMLTGRSLAYFSLYTLNSVFVLILLYSWFGFPDKGSILNLWILIIPFFFSVIFMGLTVSLLLRRREHSIMMLVFLSPVVLFLSGMSWPASSLPTSLYYIAHLFPSTSMIPAFLRIRTMGATLNDVRAELLFLIGQMVVYGILAMLSYRIYLHRKSTQN